MSKFADRLDELREKATPELWTIFNKGNTLCIDFGGRHGELPCIINWQGFDGNDLSLKENVANANLIVFQRNKAAAISALVRAAEEVANDWPALDVNLKEALAALEEK